MNALMLSAACAVKCCLGIGGAFVAGFAVGRLTKRGAASGCGGSRGADQKRGRGQQQRKPAAPRQDPPPRQPVPAGSVEIYVGNLNYDFKEDELRALFEKHGEVTSVRIVMNKYNGKSKGFGFVVMPNRAEAEKAIAAYSEMEHMGRKMRVNEAKNTISD